MMHHAIAERRGFDSALLGVGYDELAVAAVMVGLMGKLPLQREQVFLKLIAEFQNGTSIPFARASTPIGGMEILKCDDAGK